MSRAVDYALLRRVVSLSMILSRYGLLDRLKRSGAQLRGACPIHRGTNKRQFVVDPNLNTWRCFGDCDRGGSTIELVAELENVDTHEAAVRIASWFALSPPHATRQQRRSAMSANDRPSHKAFVVEDKESDDDKGFWTRIGSAWPHKDGKGLNLVLSALPTNGRIVLREFTDEDVKEEEKRKSNARRR